MMGRVFCILALVATLGGCERAGLFKSNAPTFDGQRFRTKVSTERSNRQAFAVTVHGVSKSPEGARAAGAHGHRRRVAGCLALQVQPPSETRQRW